MRVARKQRVREPVVDDRPIGSFGQRRPQIPPGNLVPAILIVRPAKAGRSVNPDRGTAREIPAEKLNAARGQSLGRFAVGVADQRPHLPGDAKKAAARAAPSPSVGHCHFQPRPFGGKGPDVGDLFDHLGHRLARPVACPGLDAQQVRARAEICGLQGRHILE